MIIQGYIITCDRCFVYGFNDFYTLCYVL